jgi:hypothetical protein
MTDIFDIPFFDDDFYKMMFRFGINFIFLTIIVRFLYYPKTRSKDYLFTYYMISIIVFFLCFTLKKYEIDLGMALGLFAIFGIIRYRTDTIAIKEMTYLFVVIGISVINSLANKKMSYIEILAANSIVIIVIMIIERFLELKNEVSKKIVYDKIENILPEKRHLLKEDLEQRTGLNIIRIKIGNVDFSREVADIKIYYYLKSE